MPTRAARLPPATAILRGVRQRGNSHDHDVGRVGAVAAAPAVAAEEAGIAAVARLSPQRLDLRCGRAVTVTAATEQPASVVAVGMNRIAVGAIADSPEGEQT